MRTFSRIVASGMVICFMAACGGDAGDEAGTPAEAGSLDTATLVQEPAPATPDSSAMPAPVEPQPARVTSTPVRMSMDEEPWAPTMTGTIDPGMTRDQVIATWGEPVSERMAGERTYLFYRNGCERECGKFDVVFLENDQVVDAIVRGLGHNYSGMSSSPPDRVGEATIPGS